MPNALVNRLNTFKQLTFIFVVGKRANKAIEKIEEKEGVATKHGSSKKRGRSKNLPGHIEPELGSNPLHGGHMKKEKQGLKRNKKRMTKNIKGKKE